MTEESNSGGPREGRELNLQKTAQQFMAGLQRHFDLLAFNLAARDRADEAGYRERARSPGAMPDPERHQNFEQMQALSRDAIARQVVGDAVNLIMACLDNAHLFLALARENAAEGGLSDDGQQRARDAQQKFTRMQLDQKFDHLEQEFDVMCDSEDTLTSLAFCAQALYRGGGTVGADHVDEQGALTLELKFARADKSPDAWALEPDNLENRVKSFGEGDAVVFSDGELQGILLTVGVFARRLFYAVAKYARSRREE